jgi:hypothetical protein
MPASRISFSAAMNFLMTVVGKYGSRGVLNWRSAATETYIIDNNNA